MTVQTDTHDQDTEAGAKTARPEATFFKLKAQLLDQGRTNTILAKTDNMEARITTAGSSRTLSMASVGAMAAQRSRPRPFFQISPSQRL